MDDVVNGITNDSADDVTNIISNDSANDISNIIVDDIERKNIVLQAVVE